MHRQGRWVPVAALGAYNLIQNLLVPPRRYVPTNVGVGLTLIGFARRRGCSWDDLGLSLTGWKGGLIIGLAGAAVTAGGAAKAAALPASHAYLLDARARDQTPQDSWYRALVRFPIGTALFEEVAFRGVIYGIWRRSGKSHRSATTATAVAFGAWHLIPSLSALTGNPLGDRLNSRSAIAGVAVVGALATGISSLGLTWLRRKTGNLIAPWLVHSAFNAAGYLAGVGAWRREHSLYEKSDLPS